MAEPKVVIDSKQFQANLKKIENFSDPILITAMEIALNVVRDHAQENHKKAPPPGMGHPDDRYYERSARLTDSIRSDDKNIKSDKNIIKGDVVAGAPGEVEYAAAVEFGTSQSRAYPFLGPALAENEKKIMVIFDRAVKQIIGG